MLGLLVLVLGVFCILILQFALDPLCQLPCSLYLFSVHITVNYINILFTVQNNKNSTSIPVIAKWQLLFSYSAFQQCYYLIMSKKQRKRLKIQQKDRDFKPPPRKLHYEEYQIPPYTEDHAKALLLQYLTYDLFQIPIHHINIFNRVRTFYQNFQNADIYMKDLDLPEVLAELEKSECLSTSKRALGTKLVTIIERVNRRRTYEEYERCIHLRPVTPPPDPITFQQQKRQATPKEKQERLKIENLLNAPSLFGEKIDIEAQLQNVVSYEQKIEALEFKQKKNLQYCDHCTRDKCQKARGHSLCKKKHFRAIINQNTDQSFGNCPHLNACHNPDCKLIHYIQQDQQSEAAQQKMLAKMRMQNAQWINCDLRYFDFKILGKFNVVMADPPWDIHMSLPYGTLKDKQLLNLRVDILQDEGLIFLWVTGRAMQLGRQCLIKWGYRRVDELVWIKTNQINRLIITGKTGHWLNHTKEHCLVGVKGNPKINTKLDCDVILSKVRETSRKPDEIYGMIERMSPGGKKIELFGRPDNCMPGWLTLGNQLTDVRLKDPEIIERYKKSYPMSDLNENRMQRNLEEMSTPDNLHKIYNNHIQKNTG